MAVDWACREREPIANDLPINDVRGLLADDQSTRHALSLELNLQHELVSRHRRALPSAIPHKPGVLAGKDCPGEARCALRERPIDSRRDRVPGRPDDRYRRDCQSTLHLDLSLFVTFRAQRNPPGKRA